MRTIPVPGHTAIRHVKALDGIRGLAILMVMVSHAFQSNSEGGGGRVVRWVGELLNYGIFGVDIFFVLSGFLITGILVDSVEGNGYFSKFYARRMLRIFPLYYGVLLLLFLMTPLLHLRWNGMGWLMVGYLQNLRPAQLGNFSPGARLGLNHFWSLAVEEQFYLVWPAVVFLVRDRRRLLLLTLGISAAALMLRLALIGGGVGHLAIHLNTATRADSLLLGGALALAYRSGSWVRVVRVAPWGLVAAVVTILASIRMVGTDFAANRVFSMGARLWVDGARYTVLALGAACLIAWALRPGSVCEWIFEREWLRFLGKYSYGIYVIHMIPLGILLAAQRSAILRLTHSKLLAVAGAGVSSLTLAVAAAYVCFHLYEKPFLRLKHRFDYASARPARRAAEVRVRLSGATLVKW